MPTTTQSGTPFPGVLSGLGSMFFRPYLPGWFSPHIDVAFGRNEEDRPVEAHVLDEVGSYGMQLNCLFDALSVLVDQMKRDGLSARQKAAVERFELVAEQADTAAAKYQGKPPKQLTRASLDDWIAALLSMKESDPEQFTECAARIRRALARADGDAIG